MKAKTKRLLCGACAIVLAITLLIGGTFAYSLRERKSNVLKSQAAYQARLVEDFDSNPEWVSGQEITKKVSVKNMGGERDFARGEWGDIYVRIMIKEYMDLAPVVYSYYSESGAPVQFMVDKGGHFVKFAVTGTEQKPDENELENIQKSTVWTSVFHDTDKMDAFVSELDADDFVKIKGLYDGDTFYWYLRSKAGDPNGQYGAFVVTEKSNGVPTVIAGEKRGDYDTYEIHEWDEFTPETCNLDTHQYVEFVLGNAVIMLNNWNGKPIKAWILDLDTGWATWGDAIPAYDKNNPQNETALLLEAVKPITSPDGELHYDIYVEMEATNWEKMPNDWVIKDAFGNREALGFSATTVNKKAGDSPFSSPKIKGLVTGDEVVDWTSSTETVATVDGDGTVTILGQGTTTISVTIKHADGTQEDISYLLIVAKGDNELKIYDDNPGYDPDKGFKTQNDDENEENDFGVYVFINANNEIQFFEHGASIPLDVILKDITDYSGINVVALDGRFTDYIEIQKDSRNGNKYSLFFNWFPMTRAELDDVAAWDGPVTFGEVDGNPTITTTIKLTLGEKETKDFRVTFYYTNSSFAI